jgi:antitoxin CptB
MSDFDRVRWHCRRGLLELDIILTRFLESGYPLLNDAQRKVFSGLLEYADNDLWDFVSGRAASPDAAEEEVLNLLRGT